MNFDETWSKSNCSRIRPYKNKMLLIFLLCDLILFMVNLFFKNYLFE